MPVQKGINTGWRPSRALHLYAIFVAFLTVILLLAGALVTSNEAGDSVPDWPLSFGRWLIHSDHFVANVRYEYSHRFIAGLVGFSTFVLALWTWRTDERKWMRRLALTAFVGVVAQALLGGVRVLLAATVPVSEVKPIVAVPHALIAQSFFALLVSIIVFTSRSWFEPREVRADAAGAQLRRLTAITVGAVLIQLVLGAGFRHLAFGVIPHVAGAVVVTLLIAWTSVATLRGYGADSYLRRPAVVALALVAAQVTLGVLAYVFRMKDAGDPVAGVAGFFGSMTLRSLGTFNEIQPREPTVSLTAAHLVVGALTLATLIVLALRCHQVLAGRERAAGVAKKTLGGSARRATV